MVLALPVDAKTVLALGWYFSSAERHMYLDHRASAIISLEMRGSR